MIGGPQGSGIDSAANIFARTCAIAGYFIYGRREYHSNIKGAHSYFQIMVSSRPINSYIDGVHLLASFEEKTVTQHMFEIFQNGALIVDSEHKGEINRSDITVFKIPYAQFLKEIGQKYEVKDTTRLLIIKNIICVTCSLGLLGVEFKYLESTLRSVFGGKKAVAVDMNIEAAKMSYEYITKYSADYKIELKKVSDEFIGKRLLINGAQAVALAKIGCGCTFQSYYPITPATDESLFLEEQYRYGVVSFQTEDEIAAITAASGAALAGARASTSTSGPGFSLMAEGLGWAGMNEVPVVVVNYQRGGPSTGLPTRTDQSDLKFAINAGHGEFPRIVISPGDIEEAFYLTYDAFNFAEKYQLPVILLCDKVIANTIQTIPIPDIKSLEVDRGYIATKEEISQYWDNEERAFKRFLLTSSCVSPRVFLGQENAIHWLSGDEHDELGHVTENSAKRSAMHAKRMNKLKLIDEQLPLLKKLSVFGEEDAACVVLSWGTTKGAIIEAIEPLKNKGIKIKFIQIKLLHPFPKNEVENLTKKAEKIIVVECNFTSQLGALLKESTGRGADHYLLKWTGRPISRTEIINGVEKVLKENIKRLELTSGV